MVSKQNQHEAHSEGYEACDHQQAVHPKYTILTLLTFHFNH